MRFSLEGQLDPDELPYFIVLSELESFDLDCPDSIWHKFRFKPLERKVPGFGAGVRKPA